MPPSFVHKHCLFTFCCLLHFYVIVTITRSTPTDPPSRVKQTPPVVSSPSCSSSSTASARASLTMAATATGEEVDPGGVRLERGPLALLAKEGPSGTSGAAGADGHHLHGSTSDLDTSPPESLSDNHVAPPDLTEEAAAAAESCPEDSVPSAEGGCECPPDGCPHFPPPPCMFRLTLVDGGGEGGGGGGGDSLGTPGHCCPRYECVGCERDEDKLLGRCQCAKGAIIDPLGRTCHCIDPHKSLVNGECVCDELKCRLPAMCNRKSVAVQVQEGCCKRTVCTPCPPDSESTGLDSDLLEDHCVCLPCHTNCGYNETVMIKKKGTGFPGSCCDLYECRQPGGVGAGVGAVSPLDEEQQQQQLPVESGGEEDAKAATATATVDTSDIYCLVGDVRYPDGATWTTRDQQICHCISGLSRCSSSEKMDESENPCFVDLKWYANGENWTKEDGCTQCICRNGEQQCISHFCEVKESHIHSGRDNDTSSGAAAASSSGDVETPCFSSDGRLYRHMHTWDENDGCATCICLTGIKHCQQNSGCSAHNNTTAASSVECQPLANCNQSCTNGYKINRRGCEICICNGDAAMAATRTTPASDGSDDLLTKYNISMADLIRILDDYRDRHSGTATPTSTTTTTTSLTTPSSIRSSSSSSSSDIEDSSETLSSRIWKEVIRGGGGAPRSDEEAERRRGGRPLLAPVPQGPVANVATQPGLVVTPTDRHGVADTTEAETGGKGGGAHVIVACVVAAAGAAAAATAFVAAFCLYRSRRKSSCSVDLTRCRYEHVDGAGATNGMRRPPTTTTFGTAVAPTLTLLLNNNNNNNKDDDDVTIKKKTTTDHPLL